MAIYTHTQLYGSGSIGEIFQVKVLILLTQVVLHILLWKPYLPLLVFMKLVPLKTLLESFENFSHPHEDPSNISSMNPWGLVTSSYIASVVVPPGQSIFDFYPDITVTGTTYRLKGTGMYSLTIS
jgi:hypothetical protein